MRALRAFLVQITVSNALFEIIFKAEWQNKNIDNQQLAFLIVDFLLQTGVFTPTFDLALNHTYTTSGP